MLFELVIGQEYFHAECKLALQKSSTFNLQMEVDFS